MRVLAGVTMTLALVLFGLGHVLNTELQEAPNLRAVLVVRMVPALLLLAAARFSTSSFATPPRRTEPGGPVWGWRSWPWRRPRSC